LSIKAGVSLAQSGLVKEDLDLARALSISTVEEFLSLYVSFPEAMSSVFRRTDLQEVMRVSPRIVNYAITRAAAEGVRARQRERGTGAKPPTEALARQRAMLHVEDLSLPGVESEERPRKFLQGCLGPIRNQGSRGTCVAHAVVALEECLEARRGGLSNLDLSEQFLYWLCKMNDGSSNEQGTWQRVAIPLIVEFGVCGEAKWPYNPLQIPNNESQGPPPMGGNSEFGDALTHRPGVGMTVDPKSVESIVRLIDAGLPVAISVPAFGNWSAISIERDGHFLMPLPDSVPDGGHAMCIIGYGYDSAFLGGGYFIVRNSWGTDWARRSPFGSGHGTLPFSYISHYGWEAFALSAQVQ
jgi:hypothetical protein